MRKAILVGLATTLLVCINLPQVAALQTEVKRQQDERTDEWIQMQRKLERQRQARARAEAAEEAAEATPTTPDYNYSGGVLSAEQVASLARGAGFPEALIPTMVDIAWGESRFNPGAINPTSGACGLWQMYPCPGPHALDPTTNASMAYAKYQAAGGLSPWGR